MQELESDFMKATGYPSLLLMEQAAQQMFNKIMAIVKPNSCFAILCGRGNNGGDTYALARLLLREGHTCKLYALGSPKSTDAKIMQSLLCKLYGVEVHELVELCFAQVDYIVDGLFGIGFAGKLDENLGELVEQINHSKIPVFAIDIPSGLDGQTGYVEGACIKAQHTFTFHRPKHGHYLALAKEYVGKLHVLDIGIPSAFDTIEGIDILEEEDARALLPAPPATAHKGDMGRVLLFAGSQNLAGAAVLLAKGARISGTGLITLASEPSCVQVVQGLEPNIMGLVIEKEEQGDAFLQAIEKCDVLAMGPGLAPSEENYKLLGKAIQKVKELEIPCILDAEGLRYLAKHPQSLAGHFLLTPHPGEAAALLDWSISEVLRDYQSTCIALHQRFGAIILLKGARSLLYDGNRFALADSGSPSLAKGGSGDALAGLLAGLLAKLFVKSSFLEKASLASYLLGRGGELAEQAVGIYPSTAKDALDAIASALSKCF